VAVKEGSAIGVPITRAPIDEDGYILPWSDWEVVVRVGVGVQVGEGEGVATCTVFVGVTVGAMSVGVRVCTRVGVHVGGQVGVGVAGSRPSTGPSRLSTMLRTTRAENT
jgi:hypothetical protein